MTRPHVCAEFPQVQSRENTNYKSKFFFYSDFFSKFCCIFFHLFIIIVFFFLFFLVQLQEYKYHFLAVVSFQSAILCGTQHIQKILASLSEDVTGIFFFDENIDVRFKEKFIVNCGFKYG